MSAGATTATEGTGLGIDVYGLAARVTGDWHEVIDAIRLDFAWFASEEEPSAGSADVDVVIERREPDFDAFGEIRASFVTPRNVVYQRGETTVIDYFGRALAVYERDRDRLTVQGTDAHLVHEAAYLFLLSRVGTRLDEIKLPRMHALGMVGEAGHAVAVMMPSGGGKSTMALRALQAPGVRLISEDSPLIDRRGRMHPFPLRVGVNETDAASLPDQHVRRIERMEFHPKLLLDIEAFSDRIATKPAPLRHIVIGRRSLGTESGLRAIPRTAVAGTLLREVVVGVGLYQGMEFVLQRGLRDVAGSIRPAITRSLACAAGLARARTWELTLGRDHARNWETVEPLLGDPVR